MLAEPGNMPAHIVIQNLTKYYGPRAAVDGLSLSIAEGELFGFVGPNGAGKTTTIRIMAALLQPNAGDILIAGHSVLSEPDWARRMTGYMPDFFGVYSDMLVWEYLDFFGACYHIHANARRGLIQDLLELVDLTHRRDDLVESLSRGMKQRLALARCLIHDPQVLILDEPASGLDPRARVEIRQLLVTLTQMGKTIFFSSHILADVAEICTRVGIIEAGRLVAIGSLAELTNRLNPHRQVTIKVLSDLEAALELLKGSPGVLQAETLENNGGSESSTINLLFNGNDAELSQVLVNLVKNQIHVLAFYEEKHNLEEIFLRSTRGQVT